MNTRIVKHTKQFPLLRLLFGIAIVVMPFNNLPYFRDILHEMANEASFYPMTIGLLLWIVSLFYSRNFLFPKSKIFLLLCLFVIFVFISFAFNFSNISIAIFKGRTGISKNILQVGLLLYMCLIPLFIYNIYNNNGNKTIIFKYIRKAILISFFIAGFYSFFEILSLLRLTGKNILSFIEPLIHDYGSYQRLRSVSGEPSYFAMYCAFIFPFMLSYLFDEKYNKIRWLFYILTGYFLFLIVLTYSRTAYFIAIVEFLFFYTLIFIIGRKNLRKYAIKSALILLIIIVTEVIVLPFFSIREYSIIKTSEVFLPGTEQVSTQFAASNNIRFASQAAALNIAIKNPIFGVGLGQYGFHFSDFFSGIDKNSQNEETQVIIQSFMRDDPSTPWPPVYSLYMRITAELGFVGLILWLSIWFFVIIKLFKRIMVNTRVTENVDWFGISLLVCTIGALSIMCAHDSFRYFGYWIILGVTFIYVQKNRTS